MSISTTDELKAQIRLVEQRTQLMEEGLKKKLQQIDKGLKPFNVFKELLPSVLRIPGLKSNLLGAALSLGLGFLTNRLIAGTSGGILRKVAGTALQVGLSSVISKKLPVWKNLAANLFSRKNGL